jgi:hypothetical protein
MARLSLKVSSLDAITRGIRLSGASPEMIGMVTGRNSDALVWNEELIFEL